MSAQSQGISYIDTCRGVHPILVSLLCRMLYYEMAISPNIERIRIKAGVKCSVLFGRELPHIGLHV